MRALLLPCLALCAVLVPTSAHAFGFGYAIEMHQFEVRVPNRPGVKVEMPTHRVRLIDTSGLLATLLASARYDRQEEIGEYHRKTTETFWGEYTPMPRGMRVILDYAFYDGDVDTQVAGAPVAEDAVEYSEFRFAVGAQLPADHFYVDFDMIDIVLRDLTGPARIDHAAWKFNLEFGGYVGPLRLGLRGEADLIAVVDSIFDDLPGGWAWGPSAYLDFPMGAITATWRSYQRVADDFGGVAAGRMLSLGAHFEFY